MMATEKDLKGRTALIGGASKGLGFACAEALAKRGCNVAIIARDPEGLEQAKARLEPHGAGVLTIPLDLTEDGSCYVGVDRAISAFGRVDILINNSGGPRPGTFDTLGDADFENACRSMLMYPVRFIRATLPHMRKHRWGRIVNIASLTVKEPAETLLLSNVFRTGVVALSRSLTKELIKSNITINTVCPGAFKTDRAVELIRNAAETQKRSFEEVEAENVKKLPLGRYQDPKELGEYVAFLCGEHASGITGTTVQIDGGIYNGLL